MLANGTLKKKISYKEENFKNNIKKKEKKQRKEVTVCWFQT